MPNMTSQSNNINAIEWWFTGYTIKDVNKITMVEGKEQRLGNIDTSRKYMLL